jgi:hypothetical protein
MGGGKALTTSEADSLLINGPTRLLMETRQLSTGALVYSWEVGQSGAVLREVFPRDPGERSRHLLIMRGAA